MKLKSSSIFQLNDMKRPVAIFYFVMFCILLFGFTVAGVNASSFNGTVIISTTSISGTGFVGMEAATVIFLFVCGLNSFKESFRMLTQNGLSRKTIFFGRIITLVSVGAGMAVIDKIILLAGKFICSYMSGVHFVGLFELIYSAHAASAGTVQMHIEGFLFNFSLYLAVITIGYFITIAFYRMSKIAKITVAVGVPMVLLNAVPYMDLVLLHGAIGNALYNTMTFAFGFKNGGNPYFGMVTCLLIFALFAGLSWVTMRKAVVKD